MESFPFTSPSPPPSTSTDPSPSLPLPHLAASRRFLFFLCGKIAVYIPGMLLSKRPDLLSLPCCSRSLSRLPLLPFPAESGELGLELLDSLKETNCAKFNCMQHSAWHTPYIPHPSSPLPHTTFWLSSSVPSSPAAAAISPSLSSSPAAAAVPPLLLSLCPHCSWHRGFWLSIPA